MKWGRVITHRVLIARIAVTLSERGSKLDLAHRLGINPGQVSHILKGRKCDATLAILATLAAEHGYAPSKTQSGFYVAAEKQKVT